MALTSFHPLAHRRDTCSHSAKAVYVQNSYVGKRQLFAQFSHEVLEILYVQLRLLPSLLSGPGFLERGRSACRGGGGRIDSNKIKKAHPLSGFLRLGPGPGRTFALGRAHGVAWAPSLRWCRRDPGRIHKGHLDPQARARPNHPQLAPEPSQSRQRGDAPLQQTRDELHEQVDGHVERIHPLLSRQLHLQAVKELGQQQGTPEL
jgi:hypothetical protein